MKILNLILVLFIFSTSLKGDEFSAHLDILEHELELNSSIPKKAFILINKHTEKFISMNAHLHTSKILDFMGDNDDLNSVPKNYKNYIVILIQRNKELADFAKKNGVEVKLNSYGSEDVSNWIKLLREYNNSTSQTNSTSPNNHNDPKNQKVDDGKASR